MYVLLLFIYYYYCYYYYYYYYSSDKRTWTDNSLCCMQARQTGAELQLQEADELRLLGKQQQDSADQPKSRRMKKDLGKLIEKYEKKHYRWGSPTKAAFLAHLTPLDAYR